MGGFELSGEPTKLSTITIGSGNVGALNTGGTDKPKVIDTKLTEDKKLAYLQAQGYSLNDAKNLLKAHPEITTQEQLALLVTNNPLTKISKPTDIKSATTEPNTSSDATGSATFNFADFSKADIATKAKVLTNEFARNQNLDNWDNMSPEEKSKAKKDAFLSFKNKSSKLVDWDKIKECLKNPEKFNELPEKKRTFYENIINTKMLDIQIANNNNESLEKYYQNDNETLTSRKYEFINNLHNTDIESYNSISDVDREFYENETIIIKAFENRFGEVNMTPMDVQDRISENKGGKISCASVVYDYLKNKQGKSELEEELFQTYDYAVKHGITLKNLPEFDSTNRTRRTMRQSEIYQNAYTDALKKSGGKNKKLAHKEAYIAYLNSEFKTADGNTLSKIEFNKKFHELLSGCSLSEAKKLFAIVNEMKANGEISFKDQNLVVNGNALVLNADNVVAKDFNNAIDNGNISSDNVAEYANFFERINYNKLAANPNDTEARNNIIESRRHNGHIIKVGENKNFALQAGVKAEIINDIAEDLNRNPMLYDENPRLALRAAGAEAVTEEYQDQYRKNTIECIKKHNLKKDYVVTAGTVSTYKNQKGAAEDFMAMEPNFDKETNILAQKAIADDIQNCNVENQVDIHKIVLKSSYSEVQEYAASNIHNYDPTAQAGAIEATYATGNQAAITACEAQLNQCSGVNASESTYANYVQNQSTAQAINNAISSGDSQQLIEIVENNNAEVTKYLNSCSEKEREEFVEKYCKVASESQLLDFVKGNSSMLGLVMRYASGKISKGKLFGAVYKGNKGEIKSLLNTLGIKGGEIIKLATLYKEFAPDIAIAAENSALARSILTDPAAWGYQLGRNETSKLREIASQNQRKQAKDTSKAVVTGDPFAIFRNPKGDVKI